MRIQLLSPLVANQIAAGEVIERPASVVKECVENSLDAGATQINIYLERGGKHCIQITDDGEGIHPDDLTLAIASHATSKISQLSDLQQLASLGFRGEALASIAAVSEFTMTSRVAEQPHAFQLNYSGRMTQPNMVPATHAVGTTVSVRDLFFNTPARRTFLRREQTEMLQIENLVKRLALSRYDVAWQFQHETKTIFNLPVAKTTGQIQQRIAKCISQNFLSQAMNIDNERAGMRLWGWLGLASLSRNSNDWQYLYLNGRIVKDKLIRHAITQAYESLIDPGRQPAYVLYLNCDPQVVDVNVHPTKHEVRFQEARQVHDFIFSSINSQLQQQNEKTSLPPSASQSQITLTNSIETVATQVEPRVIGQAHGRLILVEVVEGITLIDYAKACQAIAYQQLLHGITEDKLVTRALLVPISIACRESEIDRLKQQQQSLRKLGIVIEAMGPTSVVVRQLPAALAQADLNALLRCVAKIYEQRQQLLLALCQTIASNNAALLSREALLQFVSQVLALELSQLPPALRSAIVTWPLDHFPVYSQPTILVTADL